jgi:hypothetical protein
MSRGGAPHPLSIHHLAGRRKTYSWRTRLIVSAVFVIIR